MNGAKVRFPVVRLYTMKLTPIRRGAEIREMILSGRISTATSLIREHFPTLLDTTRDAPASRSDDEDDEMEEDEEETITVAETYTRRQTYAPAKRKSETGIEQVGAASGDSRAYTMRRLPHVNAFVAGPSGVSRVAARTGTTSSNGNGTAAATTGTAAGDVQWTAHPRTGSTNTSISAQSIQPPSDAPTVPDFPYARTYDRPTFLALNLDLQEFVEGLRVLQTQGVSSPSEANSLSNSMIEEPPTNGHASTPLLAPPPNTTSKQTRDSLILSSLSHASRLDSTARALPAREARRYAPQIQDVCGLLAYTDMESSPLAGYLEQGRRVRLAEMVEGCILCEFGPLSSSAFDRADGVCSKRRLGTRQVQYWKPYGNRTHTSGILKSDILRERALALGMETGKIVMGKRMRARRCVSLRWYVPRRDFLLLYADLFAGSAV